MMVGSLKFPPFPPGRELSSAVTNKVPGLAPLALNKEVRRGFMIESWSFRVERNVTRDRRGRL